MFFTFTQRKHGGHFFALAKLQEVDHGSATPAAVAFRNFKGFELEEAPTVGEEVHGMVGGGDEDVFDKVVVLHLGGIHATPTAFLVAVAVHRHALDVAGMADGDDHVFFGDEVFHVDVVLAKRDFGAAFVTKFGSDFVHFVADDFHHLVFIGKDGFVFGNASEQVCQFGFEFFNVQALEAAQLHFDDSLCLAVAHAKAFA